MTPRQKEVMDMMIRRNKEYGVKVLYGGFNKWEPAKIILNHVYPDDTEQTCLVGKRGGVTWGIRTKLHGTKPDGIEPKIYHDIKTDWN